MSRRCSPTGAEVAQSWLHAETSARHFGGTPEDYIAIHEWIDRFKADNGDVRHRAMLHHTQGPWMAQEVFGRTITVFDKRTGKEKSVVVRDIAENHIVEDLGWLPSPADWLSCMDCKVWFGGKRNKFIGREELLDSTVEIPNPTRKKEQ